MSQAKRRRRCQFSPEEKAAILHQLAAKVPIADSCEEHKLQPSLLYEWQRQLLDSAAWALGP